MSPTPINRRLVAVLAADAVSYSKLMSEDEEGTLRVLAAHRSVIDGIIEFHAGRIFKTAGDSVLAEFSSAVDAVRCALEIQEALKTRNDSLPEAQRLLFRIGVNLGDVVIKDEDLLGDGVNVAARLEGIAEPGSVCISSAVYDQVVGKLSLGFIDLGEKALKNIARPVHVFSVGPGHLASRDGDNAPRHHSPLLWWLAAALLAVLLGMLSLRLWPPAPAPQPVASLPASAPASDEARERLLWQTVGSSQNPAELAAYLKQYPNGMFSDVARARIAQLQASAPAATSKAVPPPTKRTAPPVTPAIAATPAAPPTPPAVSRYPLDGAWTVLLDCGRYRDSAGFRQTFPGARITQHQVTIERGQHDKPGYLKLEGHIQSDGRLDLNGHTLSVLPQIRGQSVPGSFSGRFEDEHYNSRGAFGARPCQLTLSRRTQD